MNKEKLKQILKDSDVAVFTVRKIKDLDVSRFSSGGKTKFVKYEWFKAIIEDLL